MFKKILGMSLLFLCVNTVFADIIPYVGIELGAEHERMQLKDTSSVTMNTSATGAQGGVFAGISAQVNPNILASLEGFADANSTRTPTEVINTVNGPSNATMRTRYNYGVSFLPAIYLNNNALLYVRMGIIKGRFELHQTVVPPDQNSNYARNTVNGGQVGLGIQGKIMKCTALRAEYDYNSYRTFTSFSNRVTIWDNQVKVGLLYILQ